MNFGCVVSSVETESVASELTMLLGMCWAMPLAKVSS